MAQLGRIVPKVIDARANQSLLPWSDIRRGSGRAEFYGDAGQFELSLHQDRRQPENADISVAHVGLHDFSGSVPQYASQTDRA